MCTLSCLDVLAMRLHLLNGLKLGLLLLMQIYHEMVVLERIHTTPEFSPGASIEAMTCRPLCLH